MAGVVVEGPRWVQPEQRRVMVLDSPESTWPRGVEIADARAEQGRRCSTARRRQGGRGNRAGGRRGLRLRYKKQLRRGFGPWRQRGDGELGGEAASGTQVAVAGRHRHGTGGGASE